VSAALLLAAAVLMAGQAVQGETDAGQGPLALPASFPLEMVLPGYVPLVPRSLERAEGRFTFRVQQANTLVRAGDVEARKELAPGCVDQPPGYALLEDLEATRLTAELAYGLGSGWELSLGLSGIGFSGGLMDGIIEAVHSALGLPDDGRPDRPRNEVERQVQSDDGCLEWQRSPATMYWGDTILSVRKVLSAGGLGRSAWLLEVAVELPTGDADRMTGSGGVDGRIGVHGSEGWQDRHFLTWGVGRVLVGAYDTAPLPVGGAWHGHLGYEFLTASHWSWPVQIQATDSHFGPGDGDCDKPRVLLQGGVRKENASGPRRWRWEAGFTQNLTINDNNADFALMAAFVWRWGGVSRGEVSSRGPRPRQGP